MWCVRSVWSYQSILFSFLSLDVRATNVCPCPLNHTHKKGRKSQKQITKRIFYFDSTQKLSCVGFCHLSIFILAMILKLNNYLLNLPILATIFLGIKVDLFSLNNSHNKIIKQFILSVCTEQFMDTTWKPGRYRRALDWEIGVRSSFFIYMYNDFCCSISLKIISSIK